MTIRGKEPNKRDETTRLHVDSWWRSPENRQTEERRIAAFFLKLLDHKHRRVLGACIGLTGKMQTAEEVGEQLGMPVEEVRATFNESIKLLQQKLGELMLPSAEISLGKTVH